MTAKPETRLRGRIIVALRREFDDAITVHSLVGSAFSGSGRPDLVLGVRGVYVEIEVKLPYGTATSLQAHRIRESRRRGNPSFIARTPTQAVAGVRLAVTGRFPLDNIDLDLDSFLAELDESPQDAAPSEDALGLDEDPDTQEAVDNIVSAVLAEADRPEPTPVNSGPQPAEYDFGSEQHRLQPQYSTNPTGMGSLESLTAGVWELNHNVARLCALLGAGANAFESGEVAVPQRPGTSPDGEEAPKARKGRPRKAATS